MEKYFVDVQMPGGWWNVCQTTSRTEAEEFENKQKVNGRTTRMYSNMIPANA